MENTPASSLVMNNKPSMYNPVPIVPNPTQCP